MWTVLANRTFRRLFVAQVIALVGTGLLTVALGLLAYDLAGGSAGAVLGTALAIKMIAYVTVAPVVTAVTARLSRTTVMVSADGIRAAIALLLPFVGQTWHIYVLVFVLQAASATFTPTFQSVIPTVLADDEDYTRGLSLSRLAYDTESLVSPLVAGALLLVISYDHLFVGTALGFVASAILVLSSGLPRRSTTTPLRSRMTGGITTMTRRPALRGVLALDLVVAAATALVLVDTVVYTRGILGAAEVGVAIALAAFGVGSMTVALAMPRLLRHRTDRRVMLTGGAVVPVTLASIAPLSAVTPGPVVGWIWLSASWIVLGAATSAMLTPSARVLRDESTDADRASIFTARFSLSHAWFLLTYPIAGWVGAAVGQVIAALILAALATLAASAAVRLWPVRAIDRHEVGVGG
ncbi:MFS transporter [Gordonia soli]|uniref:Putative major facilitator superfamily transporter n=1 Tax=Gordonia soli NBRC 108243 TaxID=1223545 RepID=M0QES5_9ACTN|nr:MFS transporter [Gordonia soli]GAC66939.1 putative major facilitator superfamily transporter [Gordonia soli NBRC 108243]